MIISFPLLLYLSTSYSQKHESLLSLNTWGVVILGYILSLFHFPKDKWQSYALKHSKTLLKELYIGLSSLLKLLCELIFFGFFALLIQKITSWFFEDFGDFD